MRQWLTRSCLALLVLGLSASCASGSPAETRPPNADLLSLGVDSRSSIESRVGDIPPEIAKRNAQFKLPPWTNHPLTAKERRKVLGALHKLTPLQASILQEHLRSISFADGMSNNAQTARVIGDNVSHGSFDLIIRASLLDETISQFATRKERQLFDTTGSTLSVSVEAGKMDALAFVLLHEATHMVDYTLHLTPAVAPGFPIPETSLTPFSRGVWEGSMQPAAPYRSPLLGSAFWQTGKPIPVAQARAFYDDLKRTPFPSAYASSMVSEDIAELVALRRLTEKFKQPYRIEIRDGARLVYSYEPMKSNLVRSRLLQLARFDSANVD